MMFVLAVLVGLVVGIGATLAIVLRRLSSKGRTLPVTAEWIDELSVDRYRPMFRLLDEGDMQFLKSQPGFNSRMVARLRAQRSHIFRGYLKCLDADFQRTCAALKVLMTQSHYDRPDLASTLIMAKVNFACGVAVVHLRLGLYRLGLASVDARGLVKLFDGMRVELRTLVPAGAGSMA
jgi:hypothetical protein